MLPFSAWRDFNSMPGSASCAHPAETLPLVIHVKLSTLLYLEVVTEIISSRISLRKQERSHRQRDVGDEEERTDGEDEALHRFPHGVDPCFRVTHQCARH